MVLGNDSTGDEFESTLKKHARELVDCLERGHFQQAVQLIQELSQASTRPRGRQTSETAQAAKPPPKHRETAHMIRALVSGARRETRPKCSAIRGTVKTITAAELARILTGYSKTRTNLPFSFPGKSIFRIGPPRSRMPAMAAKESCSPTSAAA